MRSNTDPFDLRSRRVRSPIPPPQARGTAAQHRQRWLAIAASIGAAAALIAACLGDRWLENTPEQFGLLEYKLCAGDTCATGSNLELVRLLNEAADAVLEENAARPPHQQLPVPARPSRAFAPAGIVALVTLGLAAAGLLIAAALALARRRYDLPVAPTTASLVGLILGIAAGCVFVATQPLKEDTLFISGWSFWAFAAGAIGGLAATFMIQREIRPVDPDPSPESSWPW